MGYVTTLHTLHGAEPAKNRRGGYRGGWVGLGAGGKMRTILRAPARDGSKRMPSNPYYKSQHWERLRSQALRRDNYVCAKCGVKCLGRKRNGISPHVDHIQERPAQAAHPTHFDVLENLRVLCAACHNRRIDQRPDVPPVGTDGFPPGWS